MEDREAGDHDIWLMRPEIRERLLQLEAFRDYDERLRAGLQAQAEAKVRASAAGKEIAGRVAEAVLEAGLRAKVECLTLFFAVKADEPTEYAVSRISSCRDIAQATEWLHRAYKGETAAEIFPESESESLPGEIADAGSDHVV